MTPSPAAITAAWNNWQLNGGKENPMGLKEVGEIVRAAFFRMQSDGFQLVRPPYEEEPPRKQRFLESVQFQGQTRTLGVDQGFRALHIADLTVPMDADGDKVQKMMASIHMIDPNDVPLIVKGHGIQLTLYGSEHPPMMLQVTSEPINEDADYTGQNDG